MSWLWCGCAGGGRGEDPGPGKEGSCEGVHSAHHHLGGCLGGAAARSQAQLWVGVAAGPQRHNNPLHRRRPCCTATPRYHGGVEKISRATRAFFHAHIPALTFFDLAKVPYPPWQRPLGVHSWRGEFLYSSGGGGAAGYKLKVFSMYAAPFREVLYLDADSMPLRDPGALFDDPLYRKNGNLFFPGERARAGGVREPGACGGGLRGGVWALARSWGSWHAFPTPPPLRRAEHNRRGVELFKRLGLVDPWAPGKEATWPLQTESGQLLVDRSRSRLPLEWALFVNTHAEVAYRDACE